jgi:hypothetical protein
MYIEVKAATGSARERNADNQINKRKTEERNIFKWVLAMVYNTKKPSNSEVKEVHHSATEP